ncbi:MAG: transposase [Nitrincola sp.]|nr:transposase [Nitrincola sp.]
MPRKPRVCPVGIPQHVIQRGNNRQICFANQKDFAIYAQYLLEASQRYSVNIHAWVFMTNHVHLLVTPKADGAVSSMMQHLGRRYVRYFNAHYQRSGTLWEGRFKSCLIDSDSYLFRCQRYIELNPVRAGMVTRPEDYHWNSYHTHARGIDSQLWTPHPQYLSLGSNKIQRIEAYQELFNNLLSGEEIQRIQYSLEKEKALGTDRFRLEMERLTGIRQRNVKPGPKPRDGGRSLWYPHEFKT